MGQIENDHQLQVTQRKLAEIELAYAKDRDVFAELSPEMSDLLRSSIVTTMATLRDEIAVYLGLDA